MSGEKRLRILVVGASGVLGRAVVRELGARHEIIAAGSKSGDIRIDIADPASIVAGLKAAGTARRGRLRRRGGEFRAAQRFRPRRRQGFGLWPRPRQ